MEWVDSGLVLHRRPLGEHDAVLAIFTRHHGRAAGLMRYAMAKRHRAYSEPGQEVQARWHARLAEQLGHFTIEPRRALAALLMEDRGRLRALLSCLALLNAALPEREPHPDLYDLTLEFLTHADTRTWLVSYIRWELALLRDMGYGLDLSTCAVTGTRDDLAYVSPRSGRAVSRQAAAPYAHRLLILPPFLVTHENSATSDDLHHGLALTGYFLQHHLFQGRRVPPERLRLAASPSEGHHDSHTDP
ncbi:MAG TPA: DNA repair protein RecO [Dongiaceae bacterium]|jgi:DNA repair protein RecO (recombination protein O)|nr:DNA repair protein RecO [Dongiaceae bacterium]